MAKEYKAFPFQLKGSNDEQGVIEGYLSVFNVVDQGNDRVLKGAFKRTLINSKKRVTETNPYIIPMLWQHKDTEPIGGVIEAYEDDHGLFTRAQFDLDVQRGREAYSGYKKGYLNQLSIGYDPIKKSYDEKNVRNLEEIRLWEQSTVTFAMNEDALVTGVKAKKAMNTPQKKDFHDRYRAQVIDGWLYSDWSDLTTALKQSIRDLFASGDSPMEDLENIVLNDGDNSQGFLTALRAYVQEGINLDYSNYLEEQASSSSYYGYMSADNDHERKAMNKTEKQTISDHAANLHDKADQILSDVKRHTKAMHSAADDLASVLQGSEPAYTTDPGTPEKSASTSSHAEHKDQHSSSADTAEIEMALAQFDLLKLK